MCSEQQAVLGWQFIAVSGVAFVVSWAVKSLPSHQQGQTRVLGQGPQRRPADEIPVLVQTAAGLPR